MEWWARSEALRYIGFRRILVCFSCTSFHCSIIPLVPERVCNRENISDDQRRSAAEWVIHQKNAHQSVGLHQVQPAQKREAWGNKRSGMKYFLCVLGMVMIVEGLPYFAAPSTIKEWIQKIAELPDSALRVLGFVAVMAGLALVYFGTR